MKFTDYLRFLVAFAGVALVLPGLCPASENTVNSEVSVDITGKDPTDARAQGLANAEIDAMKDLLNKLAPPGQGPDIFMTLDSRKISKMVKNTEVLEEKMSGNRYQARMVITVDADALSAVISKVSAQAGEDGPAAVNSFLVIPAYEEGDSSLLWDDKNPWRNVWKTVGLETPSGDIIVAYGDQKDSSVVDTKNLSSVTYEALAPLTQRYGATDVVILQAKLVRVPDLSLTVVKRRIARGRNEVNMLTYRADVEETPDMLLARAAHDIALNMQKKKVEEASGAQAVRGGEKNKVMMLASISTLASWTDLRAKLTALPMVDRVEMLAMAPKQVDMILHYRGTPDALARAIEQNHIRLVQNQDYWVVSRD